MELLLKPTPIDRPCAVALGYFDGVHIGHAAVIDDACRAAEQRGSVPTLLTFDLTGLRPPGKGSRDLISFADRLAAAETLGIRRCYAPDFRAITAMTGEQFVREVLRDTLHATSVSCGADFRFGANRSCGLAELCALSADCDIEIHAVPEVLYADLPVSTTRIKQALTDGDIPAVNAMLGRPYALSLTVYKDKQLARKMGFPTINQPFPADLHPPRFGVYHTVATTDGGRYPGASAIGVRPTVDDSGRIVLETHLIGFSGDLYGAVVPVAFERFLRDEQTFPDVAALRAQIARDIAAIEAVVTAQE